MAFGSFKKSSPVKAISRAHGSSFRVEVRTVLMAMKFGNPPGVIFEREGVRRVAACSTVFDGNSSL